MATSALTLVRQRHATTAQETRAAMPEIADWRRLRFEAVVIRKAPGTLDIANPRHACQLARWHLPAQFRGR